MTLVIILGAAALAAFYLARKSPPALPLLPSASPGPSFQNVQGAASSTAPILAASISGLDFSDPQALMQAAEAAQAAGYVESAKALATKAADTADIAAAVAGAEQLDSPITGIAADKWSRFVKLFRGKDTGEISPAYHLGLFNIGFLRLRDLGLATDVKQINIGGRNVWHGTLKPPMTMETFLKDARVQYQVFVKDMLERTEYIRKHYPHLLGKSLPELPNNPATLSGLLAVIKLAGTKGFNTWIRSRDERERFDKTTAAFKTANGIF